ncbi:hypothetical protein TSUD_189700 [Trifolium subterraneum]|uniref:Uncharacterized protein n=1 Tax=Trifolium subterraneum TaxID=3900 RepID=A0A2Z6P915_TRISU|nr:hypothetical protein TSUD_189700 [Trifolium subterraneum]
MKFNIKYNLRNKSKHRSVTNTTPSTKIAEHRSVTNPNHADNTSRTLVKNQTSTIQLIAKL